MLFPGAPVAREAERKSCLFPPTGKEGLRKEDSVWPCAGFSSGKLYGLLFLTDPFYWGEPPRPFTAVLMRLSVTALRPPWPCDQARPIIEPYDLGWPLSSVGLAVRLVNGSREKQVSLHVGVEAFKTVGVGLAVVIFPTRYR